MLSILVSLRALQENNGKQYNKGIALTNVGILKYYFKVEYKVMEGVSEKRDLYLL